MEISIFEMSEAGNKRLETGLLLIMRGLIKIDIVGICPTLSSSEANWV